MTVRGKPAIEVRAEILEECARDFSAALAVEVLEQASPNGVSNKTKVEIVRTRLRLHAAARDYAVEADRERDAAIAGELEMVTGGTLLTGDELAQMAGLADEDGHLDPELAKLVIGSSSDGGKKN